MNKRTTLAAIAAVLLLLVAPLVGGYNSLVTSQTRVETALSDLDTQYQRRMDLIPQLVNTVKGEMAHEQEVFGQIADARARIGSAASPKERDAAETELSSAMSRLLVLTENYPTLQSNRAMSELRSELAGAENRILVARKDYNQVAQRHNLKVRRFPGSLLAGMFGFDTVDQFKASEGAEKAPTVDFDKE